jgi:hypothetical protein
MSLDVIAQMQRRSDPKQIIYKILVRFVYYTRTQIIQTLIKQMDNYMNRS